MRKASNEASTSSVSSSLEAKMLEILGRRLNSPHNGECDPSCPLNEDPQDMVDSQS